MSDPFGVYRGGGQGGMQQQQMMGGGTPNGYPSDPFCKNLFPFISFSIRKE